MQYNFKYSRGNGRQRYAICTYASVQQFDWFIHEILYKRNMIRS